MPQGTLRVPIRERDAERPGLHSHAERGNDHLEHRKVVTHDQPGLIDIPGKLLVVGPVRRIAQPQADIFERPALHHLLELANRCLRKAQ